MMRIVADALSLCVAHAVTAGTPADYAYAFPIETNASTVDAATSAWRVDLTPAHERALGRQPCGLGCVPQPAELVEVFVVQGLFDAHGFRHAQTRGR